jgi:hypothetical protein
MTWAEAQLSLQLAAEERAGTVMRLVQGMARAREDAAWDALRQQQGG